MVESSIATTYHGVAILPAPHLTPGMIRSMEEGTYEGPEVRASLATIPAGARILELGAGAGVVGSVIAANCKPEKIQSIEANPDLIPHIQALYAANGLDQVINVRHCVLFSAPDSPETVDFRVRGNFLGSRLDAEGEEKGRVESVPVVRYDDLKKAFPHDVIVMDIEGGELDFLDHADLSGVNLVILEVHRKIYGREGMQRLRGIFADKGLVMDKDASIRTAHVYRREQK